jgi:hypothetical protein
MDGDGDGDGGGGGGGGGGGERERRNGHLGEVELRGPKEKKTKKMMGCHTDQGEDAQGVAFWVQTEKQFPQFHRSLAASCWEMG